jgi:hypothetical protein
MDTVLYIIAGPLFLISFCAHLYVKFRLRPAKDSDLDDYYWEFEHQHPGFARYTKWSKITFAATALSILLLFLAAIL